MPELFGYVVALALGSLGIVAAIFISQYLIQKHRESLSRRELRPGPLLVTTELLPQGRRAQYSMLCTRSVVMCVDYYLYAGMRWRRFSGGRQKPLHVLLDCGRREVLERLREEAADFGADVVLNVHLASTPVTCAQPNRSLPAIEIVAYGTAVRTEADPDAPAPTPESIPVLQANPSPRPSTGGVAGGQPL